MNRMCVSATPYGSSRGRASSLEARNMEVDQLTYRETLTAAPRNQLSAVRVDRDRQLLEALRRREPTAGERLVATYGDRAYRLAIRITGNAPDAEEAVQDAFWKWCGRSTHSGAIRPRAPGSTGSSPTLFTRKYVAERSEVPTSRWTRFSRDSIRMGGTPSRSATAACSMRSAILLASARRCSKRQQSCRSASGNQDGRIMGSIPTHS